MTMLARQPQPLTFPRLAVKPVWNFRADGTVMDLAAPTVNEICFVDMARALAGARRFDGRGIPIAQHCVMGAQAILNEGGTPLEAALFLLHDAHEWLLGDWTEPAQTLLGSLLPSLAVKSAIAQMKGGWDAAIYAAANLPLPEFWTTRQRKLVKTMDQRMCRAEAIAHFGPEAANRFPPSDPPKTSGAICIWGTARAEEKFAEYCHAFIGPDIIARQAALAARTRRRA
ncbi:hypothetical protein ABID21_000689 [Pseudorhizobium tarimense]|uniref:Uncharacterized protein n=1 Tax=Pseudorhizobium tarimense TaxID=1079109 RepID=A0ABV2H240_9HYPH|nr:hypothetical protein [Pseudorhizobium tarimense]MCJ8517796.1 hypothetical protein [Pseudorhizobium tarimense]